MFTSLNSLPAKSLMALGKKEIIKRKEDLESYLQELIKRQDLF